MPQKRGAMIPCFYPANGTASQQVLISNRHNTLAEHGVPQGRLKNLFTNVEPETKFLSDEKRGPKSEAFWVANSIKQPQNLHHCLKHGSPGQRERERESNDNDDDNRSVPSSNVAVKDAPAACDVTKEHSTQKTGSHWVNSTACD